MAGLILAPNVSQADSTSPRSFTSEGSDTKGTWHIETVDSKKFLVFSKDFQTPAGPDLKLFLSPKPVKKVGNKNATEGSLKIALLKKNKGAQRYELPANLDLSKYKTLAIHCVRYSKLFAASALR